MLVRLALKDAVCIVPVRAKFLLSIYFHIEATEP
jgi:hypothetical protein